MPAGEVQAGDIGQAVDSPKPGWNEGMLDHRVVGVPVDPHSIEEAENIIESYLMQACLATFKSGSKLVEAPLWDACINPCLDLQLLHGIQHESSLMPQGDYLLSRLNILKESVDDTEDLVNIELDQR